MKLLRVLREMALLYTGHRIPRAAAALSYYMTMSAFPLFICLYSLLGNNYAKGVQILEFLNEFLSADTIRTLRSFLAYVAMSHSTAMLIAGLMLLLTSASAAVRTLQGTIAEMQGMRRYQGLRDILFSLLISFAFLASMYFGIVVMFTGRNVLELLNGWLSFIDISSSWQWIRFLLLGCIALVDFCGIYAVSRPHRDRYVILPGALFATLGLVVMSWVFSEFIAVSTRYPLVYGSLASLILLMIWLFLCCQVIYVGATLNIALRDLGRAEGETVNDRDAGAETEKDCGTD